MSTKGKRIIWMFFALIVAGGSLLGYLEKQNELTQLRLRIPKLVLETKLIEEENVRLRYQMQEFERPEHLLQLANDPSFSHLKNPLKGELLVLQELETTFSEENFLAAGAR